MNSKLGRLGVFRGMCLCSQSARKFRKPKLKSGLGKQGEEEVISNPGWRKRNAYTVQSLSIEATWDGEEFTWGRLVRFKANGK